MLDLAHQKLDAVFAAYGWDGGMSDEEILAVLLALNLERAGDKSTAGDPVDWFKAAEKP